MLSTSEKAIGAVVPRADLVGLRQRLAGLLAAIGTQFACRAKPRFREPDLFSAGSRRW